MWFIYSLLAMSLLVTRRGTEKSLTSKIPSTAMAWLQQLAALPFMLAMLPFAMWYNPLSLGSEVSFLFLAYAILTATHLIMYFKAIQVGDISIVAPLISLTAGTSILGAFIILGQMPTFYGLLGAFLIIIGAYFAAKTKQVSKTATNNKLAVILTVIDVFLLGFYTPIEVLVIRRTNVIYFNFVSSFLAVSLVFVVILILQKNLKQKYSTNN
jgi:uncharacterized membrane protein